ncbi:Synaptophysin-like protein 1 [Galemys pyrenaicus]|uniref:Synaptophysin-like protein 1 n=1 Tax=Galemys pyrenaicus TaxID=202257 RepID=A0A8J6DHB3_GALPY|nr:Synaptophysin-like protein 1 [Galemys pyrenaicus]
MASNIYLVRQRISRLGQRMSSFQLNLNPLKEPLGFIKVLEWIASIFAFATCGGFKGKTEFLVSCPPKVSENKTITATFAYPFRLNQVSFQATPPGNVCDVPWENQVLIGDFSSSAQFYVTFAVFVFLYCIAALLLYIGYTNLYRDSRKFPMIDFVVTLVATFLWLVSTSAWAKALTDIKIVTGHTIVQELKPCHNQGVTCHFGSVTSMGSLNVSVVCMQY